MDDLDGCADVAELHFGAYGTSPAFAGIWADQRDIWPTTYPTGRRQRPRNGWQCPGCGRGFSPDILECPYYLEHPKANPLRHINGALCECEDCQ